MPQVQAALCQCCWRISGSTWSPSSRTSPVSTERALFPQNGSCFHRTSPVSAERVLFPQNESCFCRTSPVSTERVLFPQNESCFTFSPDELNRRLDIGLHRNDLWSSTKRFKSE